MSAKAIAKALYAVSEGVVDENVENVAELAADELVKLVKSTETEWDDEGAEKLALFTGAFSARVKAGLAAPAPVA